MSSKSNDQGRAFEYACIIKLKQRIEIVRPVEVDVKSTLAAKRAWDLQDIYIQNMLIKAADAFIDTLFDAEPLILECHGENDIVWLSINKDSDAECGDVRDIIIERNKIYWDIGLSMKHNHFAVKHSRLSSKIDFGNKWYGIPCSGYYWNTVIPVFNNLKELKKEKVAWRDIENKEKDIYYPLIYSFMKELELAYNADKSVIRRLMSYLLGARDFYKVVAIDTKQMTEMQTFNLRGELNHNGEYSKAAFYVPLAALPDEIIQLRIKPGSYNTVELYMNNGWSLSFRLHNASTIVEPSLKFDIQFLGVPSNIITVNCRWR